MKAYLKLFERFILRPVRREKLRSIITAAGIALGVGVIVAIRLANASSLESFRTATQSIAGETSLQLTGPTGRFDETLLARMSWLRDYGQVSPVIEGYALAQTAGDSRPGSGEMLHVLGVDIVRDGDVRDYRLLNLDNNEVRRSSRPSTRDFLLLLSDPHSIILTVRFAERSGLSVGSKVTLAIGAGRRDFIVRGLLQDHGPARALNGRVALMDIAAAQWAFDRIGLLDRVDIRLKPDLDIDAARREIEPRLPVGLVLQRPDEAYGEVEKMIGAFHFNLSALGSIALLVGLFLIYNTVSISVIARRQEVGMLRALGISRRRVIALFLGEALLLSLIGSVVGIGIGHLMAASTVRASAATVNTFYIASAATDVVSRQRLGLAEVLAALAVAVPLSLLAAALPALEASRVQPVEAFRGAERLRQSLLPPRRYLVVSLALLAGGYGLSRLGPLRGLPIFGYFSAVSLVFAGALLVPMCIWSVCRVCGFLVPKIARSLTVESRIASSDLGAAIPRVSISVAALAVSLSMMIAVSIMISSFRDTVSYWIGQTLAADIYVRPITRESTLMDGEIAPEALGIIEADPAVAAVDTFTSRPVSYQGRSITLGAGDFNVLLDHGRWQFKSPSNAKEKIREAVGQDAVVVSESFSLLFNKRAGDLVEIDSPSGPRKFEVAAVYFDYSSNRGIVVVDRSTYSRVFLAGGNGGSAGFRPSGLSVYLRPGADAESVTETLSRALAGKYALVFATNGQVRGEALRIFDSTFAITYALEAIAILVAALGVVSTLITVILERRRELSILQFIGATRARIRRIIVSEALLIGMVSQLIGVGIGILLSLVLIYVINVQSFGWTIQYHLPVGFVIQSTVVLLIFCAAAGLYPAVRAARINALDYLKEE
jgi:putative ABC transport system permease protein